jgi:hypothetical protein
MWRIFGCFLKIRYRTVCPTKMALYISVLKDVATIVIAVYVAVIGTRQWFTARDKLRFDLYNRRFEIYAATLAFVQALTDWKDFPVDERKQRRIRFVLASREAKFLFPKKSGVPSLLEELHVRSFKVTGFIEAGSLLKQIPPEDYIAMYDKKQENLNWTLESLSKIEEQMEPFMRFSL